MIMKLGQCFFTDIWIFAQIVNCITHQLLIVEVALYFDCPLIHFKFIESLTVEKASDVLISDIIFLQSRLSYHYVLISLSLKYIDIVDIEVWLHSRSRGIAEASVVEVLGWILLAVKILSHKRIDVMMHWIRGCSLLHKVNLLLSRRLIVSIVNVAVLPRVYRAVFDCNPWKILLELWIMHVEHVWMLALLI